MWVRQARAVEFRVIEELLEWSPFVIVDTSEAEWFASHGIKVDAIVASSTQATKVEHLVKDQWPVTIIQHTDNSAVGNVLSFLEQGGHHALNVVAKSESLLQKLEKANLANISVLEGNIRWVLVRQGHFEKYMASDASVKIFTKGVIQIFQPVHQRVRLDIPTPFWVGEALT